MPYLPAFSYSRCWSDVGQVEGIVLIIVDQHVLEAFYRYASQSIYPSVGASSLYESEGKAASLA